MSKNNPNVFPIGKRFLVLVDESEAITAKGIHLPEAEKQYTGVVVKLPANVVALSTIGENERVYFTGSPLSKKDDKLVLGEYIEVGTHIQWSSQSGFATTIPIAEIIDDVRVVTQYLLFTVDDVDIILPD